MNMEKEFDIIKYDEKKFEDLYDEIISIIEDGDDLSDFDDTLNNAADNIFLAFLDGFLAGVAWFTIPADNESVVGVWVKERYRSKGVANGLLKVIDERIHNLPKKNDLAVYAFSEDGKKSSTLIDASGFSYSHSYVTMNYFKNDHENNFSGAKIECYYDELYEQMVELRNNGIKEAAKFYGEDAKDLFFVDDVEYRKYMKDSSKKAFVIVNDGILDGFVMVRGSEIMALNVRPEKRGRGYAEALVFRCIQYLEKMHNQCIELICVDKNIPAYNLYKKIGFKTVGWVCCYRKVYSK